MGKTNFISIRAACFMCYRVAMFTKKDDPEFGSLIESSLASSISTTKTKTTIVLYEKGIKPSRSLTQRFIHLFLDEDPAKVADLLCGYFEALKLEKSEHKLNSKGLVKKRENGRRKDCFGCIAMPSIVGSFNFSYIFS